MITIDNPYATEPFPTTGDFHHDSYPLSSQDAHPSMPQRRYDHRRELGSNRRTCCAEGEPMLLETVAVWAG